MARREQQRRPVVDELEAGPRAERTKLLFSAVIEPTDFMPKGQDGFITLPPRRRICFTNDAATRIARLRSREKPRCSRAPTGVATALPACQRRGFTHDLT